MQIPKWVAEIVYKHTILTHKSNSPHMEVVTEAMQAYTKLVLDFVSYSPKAFSAFEGKVLKESGNRATSEDLITMFEEYHQQKNELHFNR